MNMPSNSTKTRCYGIDVTETGALLVVEKMDNQLAVSMQYSADERGISALKERIANSSGARRICIRSCGAAALSVALALLAVPRLEVMLVAPRALYPMHRTGGALPLATSQARAERLVLLAERML
jgi:hypothetical protein